MSFQGLIEDVAVADVMQLIRLGGHSGTLTVKWGKEEAIVGFERGRIVNAWNPRTRRYRHWKPRTRSARAGPSARSWFAWG